MTTPANHRSPPHVLPWAAAALLVAAIPAQRQWVLTGPAVPQLMAFENAMTSFMANEQISAGALAVTYNGKLVYSRGFNYTITGSSSTQPDSLFRIASISKTLTAVGVLRLVESGQIGLDQPLHRSWTCRLGWIRTRPRSPCGTCSNTRLGSAEAGQPFPLPGRCYPARQGAA